MQQNTQQTNFTCGPFGCRGPGLKGGGGGDQKFDGSPVKTSQVTW